LALPEFFDLMTLGRQAQATATLFASANPQVSDCFRHL
jgi:hypothetical protein